MSAWEVEEHPLTFGGRRVRWYSAGPADAALTVMWHHGTPNTGEPPEPLFEASAARGIRWLGFDRAGYGESEREQGRSIADAARVALAVADDAGVHTFAAAGHSGGGPHAMAAAVLAPERVAAVVSVSGLAPLNADGLDYYAGMHPGSAAELRAAQAGAGQVEALLAATEFDPELFTQADWAALEGTWAWLNKVAAQGVANGLAGSVDDNRAYVTDWGVDVRRVAVPVLLVHGTEDRVVPISQSRWLARHVESARLWEREGAGHISALGDGEDILDWLIDTVRA
jgi:pimeloyl-ACP methyl ester carboxylesterase